MKTKPKQFLLNIHSIVLKFVMKIVGYVFSRGLMFHSVMSSFVRGFLPKRKR
jgi:hypothetical protein